jgi:hypothetical protein
VLLKINYRFQIKENMRVSQKVSAISVLLNNTVKISMHTITSFSIHSQEPG